MIDRNWIIVRCDGPYCHNMIEFEVEDYESLFQINEKIWCFGIWTIVKGKHFCSRECEKEKEKL